MNLDIKKPIAFFDLETTGVDISKDRIVQIAIVKMMPDGNFIHYETKINPLIQIPPSASAVHGITDDMVKDAPALKDIAKDIMFEFFIGSDIGGYNILNFDVPLMNVEMERCGLRFPEEGVKYVDAFKIFTKYEERTLSAAKKFYLGQEHDGAHDALNDTRATVDVLMAQVQRYALDGTIESLHDISTQGRKIIDFAGKLKYDEAGDVVYAFGKNAGKRVKDYPDYATWMLGADFTADTKRHIKSILNPTSAII